MLTAFLVWTKSPLCPLVMVSFSKDILLLVPKYPRLQGYGLMAVDSTQELLNYSSGLNDLASCLALGFKIRMNNFTCLS